ncbi:hypothetical protein V1511DRAFT_504869 [Dipodascopsis uninucleata]
MLSDNILSLLSDSDRSFISVSKMIIDGFTGQEIKLFYLAFDVLVMLEETFIQERASEQQNKDLTARVLNGEYLLYMMYWENGTIALNPFLAHFVSVLDIGKHIDPNSRNQLDRLRRMQTCLVCHFLEGNSDSIINFNGNVDGLDERSGMSVSRFVDIAESHFVDINTKTFYEALVNQGIIDSVPSEQSELNATDKQHFQGLLRQARTEELSESDTRALIEALRLDSNFLLSSSDISGPAVASLMQYNLGFARSFILLLLATDHRSNILETLQSLPATLKVLDGLSFFFMPNETVLSDDEKSGLLHAFLSNSTRTIESNSLQDARDETFSEQVNEGVDVRGDVTRQVQLLCLFIQSLLRVGAITMNEYVYEIQALTVRFIYVPEARELFQIVKRLISQSSGHASYPSSQRMSIQVV